jgi:hypothetical protein
MPKQPVRNPRNRRPIAFGMGNTKHHYKKNGEQGFSGHIIWNVYIKNKKGVPP